MDVTTGTNLPERIADTSLATPQWLPDNSGFFYNQLTGKISALDDVDSFTLVPAVFMFLTTLASLGILMAGYVRQRNFVLIAADLLLFLLSLGVPAKQVETVSFGAEKPKALGSNEEAWAENRRSDIVYIGIDSQQ
jgi:hypothetical protein